MAASSSSPLQRLRSCFSEEWIRDEARRTGVVKRERKVDIVQFFWALVTGFGVNHVRTLASLRRAFELASGVTLVPSAFYDRFTPQLCIFLKKAVARACLRLSEPLEQLQGPLAGFADLVVADGTVMRLKNLLESSFPATRTNVTRAAMKLHVVMSALAVCPRTIQVRGERAQEVNLIKIGSWVKGRLLLMDLGYFKYQLLARIARNGGFFVTRLRADANPRVVKVLKQHRGRAIDLVGRKVRDVMCDLRRETLDAEVEVEVRRRPYAGRRSRDTRRFRLIGRRNAENDDYHLYLTNIPPDRLTPEDVARTYAARWEIELLFKELKSGYRMHDLPSTQPHIVEALVHLAILTLIVSRSLLAELRRSTGLPASRTPERRWAVVFKAFIQPLLSQLLHPRSGNRTWKRLEYLLKHEFVDPNRSRQRNLEFCRA